MNLLAMGEMIRVAREQAGLTQEELGKTVGVSGVSIMRYEKGQRRPRYETARAIGDALGVSLFTPFETTNARLMDYAKEDFRNAILSRRFSDAFYSLLAKTYGKPTEHRTSVCDGVDECFIVYENDGDPIVLFDDDIQIIVESVFSLVNTMALMLSTTEQKAEKEMNERIEKIKEMIREEKIRENENIHPENGKKSQTKKEP